MTFLLRFWLLIMFAGGVLPLFGQNFYSSAARMEFLKESYQAGEYQTALTEARLLMAESPGLSPDSLSYFAGRSLLMIGDLASANQFLSQVSSENEPFFRFSHAAMSYAAFVEDKHDDMARHREVLEAKTDFYTGYGTLVQGADLLMHLDTSAYRTLRAQDLASNPYINKSLKEIDAQLTQFQSAKKKRPVTAGLLSAILPGAGKCYMGKWGTGILSFLSIGGVGYQAYEGYRKGGVKSPQFIGFSALFGLVYAANIYGTVSQAKAYNIQLVSDFKNGVALQVDISFDRLFSR